MLFSPLNLYGKAFQTTPELCPWVILGLVKLTREVKQHMDLGEKYRDVEQTSGAEP